MNQPSTQLVSPVLASVLRSGREHFNALFSHARRQYGELDAQAFSEYVRGVIDPLAQETARVAEAQVGPVTQVAYEVGIELAGQRLCGGSARHPHLDVGLGRLLPLYAPLVAAEPWRVIASLANALDNLATTSGAKPTWFIDELSRVAAQIPDVSALLDVGQVLAWRAGMAHFREGALANLARLPAHLASLALDLPPKGSLPQVIERLEHDPWFDPRRNETSTGLWVGAYVGFGGLFAEPPVVTTSDGHVLVRSAGQSWLLMADAFGATLHRATDGELAAAEDVGMDDSVSAANGELSLNGNHVPFTPRGDIASVARVPGSCAVSFSMSHSVLVLPYPGAA